MNFGHHFATAAVATEAKVKWIEFMIAERVWTQIAICDPGF